MDASAGDGERGCGYGVGASAGGAAGRDWRGVSGR